MIFFTIRSIVNRDSIAKFNLLTIEYAIQILFKCARTNHRQVYSFPQHCAIISRGPSRLTLTDLATGRERQLTTGKSAERTEHDLRCPICRSATGQAII